VKASLPERVGWTFYLAYHWRGQSAFPFRSRTAIASAQSRRLSSIVTHAYKTVPYYRETMQRRGLLPVDFRTADDLSLLPIIDRDQLQRDPEYFESVLPRGGRDIDVRSGGSTGAPRVIKWDTGAIFQNAGHAERERSIIATAVGRFVNYRESVIASQFGAEEDVQEIYSERAILPSKSRVQYQHLSLTDSPELNTRLLNEFKPDVIRSYGSYLGKLFSWIHATRTPFHRPRVVFYDADELSPTARSLITNEFAIEVLSAYQAVEAFKIGFECNSHSGMHLNIDLYPVRIVNDRDENALPGESGQVIVSNLVNRATVLLNYRIGDVAQLIADQCPCGRQLPLMSYIEGRSDDWIRLDSGEMLHPQAVRTIFTPETSIRQYQVTQREPKAFTVDIESFTADEELEQRVRSRFAERFGADVSVDVRFVERVEPSAGGKVRPVISLASR
jgi:phenylacetate-CoA ligase